MTTENTTCYNLGCLYLADKFAVHSETGVMTVIGDLDEENTDMYSLTVQAVNDMAAGATPVNVSILGHPGYSYSLGDI